MSQDEKLINLIRELLSATYRALDHYYRPTPDGWDVFIGDDTGKRSPDELLGTYKSERAAMVAVTRELDKRYPGQWEIYGTEQIVSKHTRLAEKVLATVSARHERQ